MTLPFKGFDKIAGTVKMYDLTPTIDADFYLPF